MTVFLVGAGPGSRDLLTLRAAQLLERADVVVHDRLIGEDVLDLIPVNTPRIDVGKIPGTSHSQAAINETLIELAAHYHTIVRLKGGDPFVFGRGGEEVQALTEAGIAVEVVPGISSVFAAPALAGIPVTHRGVSQGVLVVTATGKEGSAIDFRPYALSRLTIIVLMGVAQRATIAQQLIEGGLAPDTPVAVIERASTPSQRVVRTPLRELGKRDVANPAVMLIGAVAALNFDVATVLEMSLA
jgi:uroporphyrin-III C-methyltransferase